MKAQSFRTWLFLGNYSLAEVTHALVLGRHCHRLEVMIVSDGLEIATNQEQIYFVLLFSF